MLVRRGGHPLEHLQMESSVDSLLSPPPRPQRKMHPLADYVEASPSPGASSVESLSQRATNQPQFEWAGALQRKKLRTAEASNAQMSLAAFIGGPFPWRQGRAAPAQLC